MRLFIAINPEPEIRDEVFTATEPLRHMLPDARWVAPELLHLTVKFLGERTPADADRLAALLDDIGGRYRTIDYTVQGIGAFPNLRRPAVVWISVLADAKLELLYHDTESACVEVGVSLEGRAFRPHITLGRIRNLKTELLRPFANACERIVYQSRTTVRSIDLMLSQHKDRRLSYSVLHSAALRP
jgi:RNA 2',3'-cyclic 3'-phosphodiesterase